MRAQKTNRAVGTKIPQHLLAAAMMLCFAWAGSSALWAEGPTSYGEGVTEEGSTSIAEILASPDDFEGKEVQVAGKVTDVCPKKGCWMELRDETDASLRVKVQDDVIVFPADAKGKLAKARGKVEILNMDREKYLGWMQHLAEERGETFDESTLGDGPYRIVQLAGSGAQISH